MSNHTQSKRNSITSIGACLFILILLASILSSCGTVLQTPGSLVLSNVSTPTTQNLPADVLTSLSPTETASVIPLSNVTLESLTSLEDMQKLIEMFEANKDIDKVVLASEQVISDFYSKVIPNESDLRVSLGDMTHYFMLGEPLVSRDGSVARVQATLLGGFTTNNGAYLLLGTENAATGDRSIVPIQFTFGVDGLYSTLGIKKDNTQKRIMDYSGNITEFISAEELLGIVREYLGKNILLSLSFYMDINSPGTLEEFKLVNEKYFFIERLESNKLFINDPLHIDKSNLNRVPCTNHLYY